MFSTLPRAYALGFIILPLRGWPRWRPALPHTTREGWGNRLGHGKDYFPVYPRVAASQVPFVGCDGMFVGGVAQGTLVKSKNSVISI